MTNKVAVFTTTWKREKGLFQAGHKTSLGLSRALWMKATVVNLRLAGPITHNNGGHLPCEVESLHILKVKYASKDWHVLDRVMDGSV